MSATKTAGKTSTGTTDEHAPLRQQLIDLLHGGQAHATFDDAIKDFPANLRGTVPPNLPYSAWQLLEHLRIAQRDILNFSAPPTGGYHPMRWPQDYWPTIARAPHRRRLGPIHRRSSTPISKPSSPSSKTRTSDLFKPFRWGDGQNLLREALLIADHNAYHLGELIVLRRLLGAWHK